jgi:hypothetical protein
MARSLNRGDWSRWIRSSMYLFVNCLRLLQEKIDPVSKVCVPLKHSFTQVLTDVKEGVLELLCSNTASEVLNRLWINSLISLYIPRRLGERSWKGSAIVVWFPAEINLELQFNLNYAQSIPHLSVIGFNEIKKVKDFNDSN